MTTQQTRPEVSAVVVTWNSNSDIVECLTSLERELAPLPSEIIVVDNGSGDGTVETVRAVAPAARVIANPANRGLAAANNQGLAAARGSIVLICNADVVFRPDSVRAMVDLLGRHQRAGWVVPRILHEDGAVQTSVGDLPSLGETLLGRQVARRRAPGDRSGFWWDGWAHDAELMVGRGFECAYAVRRSALNDVGGQDERYVLDWEGFDWAERFHRAGWEIWFTPNAEVVHFGGTSRRQVPFRSVVSQHRGMYLYFSDRGPKARKPFLALAFTTRAAVKLLLTALGVPLYRWAHRDRRRGA
ncbi:MAG TPA: glycosyltransferase family 2 protein [Acidimicrobiales bacterium]|jgi:hypothetical protein